MNRTSLTLTRIILCGLTDDWGMTKCVRSSNRSFDKKISREKALLAWPFVEMPGAPQNDVRQ
jgi:hypothetical protein